MSAPETPETRATVERYTNATKTFAASTVAEWLEVARSDLPQKTKVERFKALRALAEETFSNSSDLVRGFFNERIVAEFRAAFPNPLEFAPFYAGVALEIECEVVTRLMGAIERAKEES